jgi:hypothetical protein
MRAKNALLAAAVLTTAAACFTRALSEKITTQFDGTWRAALTTRSGECDRSGHVTGKIVNGALVSPGGGVSVSGNVKEDGELSGKVSMGSYYIIGSGRLVGSSGSGTWQGVGPSGPCSGIWNASRQ